MNTAHFQALKIKLPTPTHLLINKIDNLILLRTASFIIKKQQKLQKSLFR